MRNKKVYSCLNVFISLLLIAIFGFDLKAVKAEEADLYTVISTCESLPDNICMRTENPVTFDHTAGTDSKDNYVTRYCWGLTQCWQGNIKLDSYTRARYESIFGGITADSGRQWSENQGKSYAESGNVSADIGSQWVGHTYYGNE